MSLIPTIYSSTDPGAPALSGTVGSLLNLMRALLVTGYGSSPNAKPGLGWTEAFTGANKAAFRNSPITGSGYYLQVDDTNANYGLLRAFETMTAIDTGTNLVPTAAQLANGLIWAKSSQASAVARAWFAIGTETCVYLFMDSDGKLLENAAPHFAGDLISLKPGDLHAFAISTYGGAGIYSVNSNTNLFYTASSMQTGADTISAAPLVIARSSSGATGAVLGTHLNLVGAWPAGRGYGGTASPQIPYPAPNIGGLLYDRPLINDAAYSPRGYFPGLYAPLHNRPLADLSQLLEPDGRPAGTIFLARSYRSFSIGQTTGNGQLLFDLTAEWA